MVTVVAPDQRSLKIPLWMVRAESTQIQVVDTAVLPCSALLAVAQLFLDCSGVTVSELLQPEASHGTKRTGVRKRRDR
jgi:hypothetical protein